MAKTVGAYGIYGNVHSRGKIKDEAIPVQSPSSVEQAETTRFRSNQDLDSVEEGVRLVDGRGSIEQRSIASNQEPEPVLVLRRVKRGMGSNSRREPKFRQMVPTGTAAAHKPEGTTGSLESSDSSRKFGGRKDSCCDVGQYDGSCLSVQSGGHEVLGTVLSNKAHPDLDNGTGDSVNTPICSRNRECHCRYPEQEGSNSAHRVVSPSRSLQDSMEEVGTTLSRPLCHKPQSQATKVCFSTPGSSSMGSGCLPIPMVQPGPVCLSSLCSDKESDKSIQKFQEQQNDVSGPMVATKRMVSRSVGTSDGCSNEVTHKKGSSKTTSRRNDSPRYPHASASRVETLNRILRARGFSKEVSQSIIGARRSSTNRLYQIQWHTYRNWCKANKCSATRTNANNICKFFRYLRYEKHLSVGSIKGYRAMLGTVLRHYKMNLADDKDIADVIRFFQLEVPKKHSNSLGWNLDVVLKYLCMPKFEPLESSSLLNLTKKAIFLTALCTAKRVSELQAFSSNVGFSKGEAVLTLLWGFRAKNDNKCQALPRHCNIKNLTDLVGNEEEAKLCPVRTLKEYLKRTRPLVAGSHRHLFCSPRKPKRPMSKNGISFFIRDLIKEAHKELKEDMLPMLKVRAHDVRAVATSVNFAKNLSLEKVLDAAQWKCKSVFASNYLKDIQISYEKCCTLGPLVAAGSVIT